MVSAVRRRSGPGVGPAALGGTMCSECEDIGEMLRWHVCWSTLVWLLCVVLGW